MKSNVFKCPKCGFVQGYACLDAATGQVSDNRKDKADRPCPNDGAELLPVFDESELQ
jgi:predicted RNA-binding Zn-ribbon protein involved in translation (DUF1610 family)